MNALALDIPYPPHLSARNTSAGTVLKRGRQTIYTPELGRMVFEHMCMRWTLAEIAQLPGAPCPMTVSRWCESQPDFFALYTRAREVQADAFAEEIAQIVQDPNLDPNEKKARMNGLQWLAAKFKVKVYGDKQQIEHSGSIDIGLASRVESARARAAIDVTPIIPALSNPK